MPGVLLSGIPPPSAVTRVAATTNHPGVPARLPRPPRGPQAAPPSLTQALAQPVPDTLSEPALCRV